MVGLDRAVFGRDRGALDQRQEVALDAFAADRSAAHVADRDLVDLVEKDDAVLFGIGQRDAGDIVLVEPGVLLFLDEPVPCFGNLHLTTFLGLLTQRLAHHFGQVDHADIAAHAAQVHLHIGGFGDLDFDLGVVHLIGFDTLPERQPRRLARSLAGQSVEQSLHRCLRGGLADRLAAAVAFEPNGVFDEVAGDLFDIASDIADFGELGRLYLDEGGIGQLGETARNLGLAATGRADHQDILGRHLVAKFGIDVLTPPAIAQGDRDRTLGVLLADDMLVERRDYRLGGQARAACIIGAHVALSIVSSVVDSLV